MERMDYDELVCVYGIYLVDTDEPYMENLTLSSAEDLASLLRDEGLDVFVQHMN